MNKTETFKKVYLNGDKKNLPKKGTYYCAKRRGAGVPIVIFLSPDSINYADFEWYLQPIEQPDPLPAGKEIPAGAERETIEKAVQMSDEELTKESIYIERIKNLQAIIRHCDCPAIDNPRFEMVTELTKKDKEFQLAINLLAESNEIKGETDADIEAFLDDFAKPHEDICLYSYEEMVDCFHAGFKFSRDMANNPSDSEYMRALRGRK